MAKRFHTTRKVPDFYVLSCDRRKPRKKQALKTCECGECRKPSLLRPQFAIFSLLACLLATPAYADPFGILGQAGSIFNTLDRHKQAKERAEDRERQQTLEAERLEMERLRLEMELQRFQMEMLERKKALAE